MGRGRFLGAVGLLTCALASPALAQDPDVIVDPESPSAKEYAIPLERARQEATGMLAATAGRNGKGKKRAPRVTPLFGVGIAIKTRAATPKRAQRTTATTRRARRNLNRGRVRDGVHVQRAVPDLRPLVATPAGGIADLALLGAGGGAVLLLGALLGVAVRRRPGAPRGL